MTRTLICLLVSIPATLVASRPLNTITVTDTSGSPQANRTVVVSRVFAEGDIPQYAKPVVVGQTISIWQNDVKVRYHDGNASVPVTGATNEAPITITGANHGFLTGEWVTVSGVGGNTAANGRWRIIRLNRDKFILQGSTGNGSYTSGGSVSGPGPGSARHDIVSFVIPSIGANATVTVAFAPTSSPCSSGDQPACAAAALDGTEMLAFLSGGWDSKIKATQGNTVSVSARTMLADGNFSYWLRGPAATVVVAEDATTARSYDFGWSCTANCTGDHSGSTWVSDATNKSLHPSFSLWFFPADGTPRLRTDYTIENDWTTLLQTQRYAPSFTVGTADTVAYAKAQTTQWTMTRWHRGGDLIPAMWQPSAPGGINVDFNFEYLMYSKAIPMYNSIGWPLAQPDVDLVVNGAAGKDFDLNGDGWYNKQGGTTGGATYLGLWPDEMTRWLFSQKASLYKELLKSASVAGNIPLHLRESDSSLYFVDYDMDGATRSDSGDNVANNAAFGRVASIDARPTYVFYNNDGLGSDPLVPLETLPDDGWWVDFDHLPDYAYIPYLATGDPFYLQEVQFAGAVVWFNGSYGLTTYYGRHGGTGHFHLQTRGVAWAMRTAGHAVVMSPDGSSEKDLFTTKFDNHVAHEEGFQWVKNGEHFRPITNAPSTDPCPGSAGTNAGKSYSAYNANTYAPATFNAWCHGYKTDNYGYLSAFVFDPLGFPDWNDNSAEVSSTYGMDNTLTEHINAPWMLGYKFISIGHLLELGLPLKAMADKEARVSIGVLSHPAYNHALAANYHMPVRMLASSDRFAVSWPEVLSGWSSSWQSRSIEDMYPSGDASVNQSHPYTGIIQSGVSFFHDLRYGQSSGEAAWNWGVGNFPGQNQVAGGVLYPQWRMMPRRDPTRVLGIQPGESVALLSYVAPTADACILKIDDDGDFSSPVINSSDSGTVRNRQFLASGLSASTAYHYRITCASDPYNGGNTEGQFTTQPAGGPTTLRVALAPPAGYSVDNAVVDYGATPGLGSSTSPVSCASGCTVDVAASAGVALYYRWRYCTAGSQTITTSTTIATIP